MSGADLLVCLLGFVLMGYYERRLPHWHPERAAVFVTWRLHGSLPGSTWKVLPPMPTGKAFVAIDRELAKAATGPTWLKDEQVARAVADTLSFGEDSLGMYSLASWVLMSNHVHILIGPRVEFPRIMKSIKTFSARRSNEILGRTGEPFWGDESYDHWVRDQREFGKIAQYIEFNPVTAGLVARPEDWRWSSAYKKQTQEGRPGGPPHYAK